jgi:hypothetical protein
MKLLTTALCMWLATSDLFAQTTLFQQNFDGGGIPANYVSSNPNVNQFNGISGATITNGTLQFDRSSGTGTGHFSRTTDLSPSVRSMYIQMDFEVVSTTATAGNNVLNFYVGSNFTSDVQNPDNGETYARFGFSFTNNGHEFMVRSVPAGGTGAANSVPYTGRRTLTFVLNNTDYLVTYLQPGGGLKTLPNDTYDLWVGADRVFTELPVLTPGQTLSDFKFRLTNNVYAAAFQIDNILIRDISGALPIELTHFEAKSNGPHVELNWTTTKLLTAAQFTVERHTGSGEFVDIGESTPGTLPTTTSQRTYTFTDEQPAPGLNHYRLRQVSTGGLASWSKVIQVRYQPGQPALLLLENPALPEGIRVRTYALDTPTYRLCTAAGQPLFCQLRETPDGTATLLPQQPLPAGVYLLTVNSENTRITKRVLVR